MKQFNTLEVEKAKLKMVINILSDFINHIEIVEIQDFLKGEHQTKTKKL